MAAFAITAAAAVAIQERIEFSTLEQPIASLLDRSQSFPPSAEMLDAISRRIGDEEMLALAIKEHRDREPTLNMHLDVGIYNLADIPPEYRLEIAGFPFSMAQAMLERLSDHVLDHDGRRFVLRRGDRVFASLTKWAKGLENIE